VRLVTSFATGDDDIDRFVNLCARSVTRLRVAPI
jgi:threonine aldolase